MLMLVRIDSTSNLGNTISGVIQIVAPVMREEKKNSLSLWNTGFKIW